jgi:hypothetical protein
MNLPLTFAALLALTGALVLLRFFWPRLSRPTQSLLIACACIVPTLFAIASVTGWSSSSIRWNAAFYWGCIASYEFLLILFTRLCPRWLTSIIATILILPILSASVFLPLAALFDPPPVTTVVLGDHLISERTPWGSGPVATTGTDLTIYYQPSWAPFVHRHRLSCRYFGSQCNAAEAYAVLQPDNKSVMMSCPASPDQPPETAHNLVMKLK